MGGRRGWMKNSKSDGWILRVAAAGNQYAGERSRCGSELSIASCSCVRIRLEIAAVYFTSVPV